MRADQGCQFLTTVVQDAIGEDWHQYRVGHADGADQAEQQAQRSDRRSAAYEIKSLANMLQGRSVRRNSRRSMHIHHQQSNNHRNVTDAINEETPALA